MKSCLKEILISLWSNLEVTAQGGFLGQGSRVKTLKEAKGTLQNVVER